MQSRHVFCKYNVRQYESSLHVQVLDAMMAGMASIYNIPHYHSVGFLCKTNLPSSTAMRGFGMPQAHYTLQSIMFDIAKQLNMPLNRVSRKITLCYKFIKEWHVNKQ